MNDDPVRLKDAEDVPEELRQAMREGTAIAPMPEDVRASLVASLAALPSATSAGPTSTVKAKGIRALATSKSAWVIGTLSITTVAAAVVIVNGSSGTSRGKDVNVTVDAVAPPPESPSASAPEPISPPEPSPSSMPSVTNGPKNEPSRASTKVTEVGTLAEESALVGRARKALGTDPASALATVEEHARRFPHGELAPERDYVRVSALRRLRIAARKPKRTQNRTSRPIRVVPMLRRCAPLLDELGGP